MISTDDVKRALDDTGVVDSRPIINELNRLQSQKFIDPNCDPSPKEVIDILKESFCDNPLDNRNERLNDFLNNLPDLPSPADKAQCAQDTLNKIQDLINRKFSFKNLEEDIKKNKFSEEKVEAQLSIILHVAAYVHALCQMKSLPLLSSASASILTTLINNLNSLRIEDQIALFERRFAVDKLTQARNRFYSTELDKETYDVSSSPEASFIANQQNILGRIVSPIMMQQTGIFIRLNDQITYTQRVPSGSFGQLYKNLGDKMIKSPTSIDQYYTDTITLKTEMLNGIHNDIINASLFGIIKLQAYSWRNTPDIDVVGEANTAFIFLIESCNRLVPLYNLYINETPKTPNEQDVVSELSKLNLCGTQLPNSVPQQGPLPDSSNPADLSHNTFDQGNRPTITDLDYWKRYSIYLTLANLSPTFWTIGLYIPTPSGIVKVPLPTVWRPLFVFNAAPFGIIVIFLTINGLAISPTVWVYKFPPFGKNESNLLVMLRAFNKKIKDDTGNALLNVPVINGINVNPTLTKTLPFKQDDLPTIRRLGLSNAPYLLYLTQWLKQYKTGGGLP